MGKYTFICDSGVMIEKEHLISGMFSKMYLYPFVFSNISCISGVFELQQYSHTDTPGSKTWMGNNQYAG